MVFFKISSLSAIASHWYRAIRVFIVTTALVLHGCQSFTLKEQRFSQPAGTHTQKAKGYHPHLITSDGKDLFAQSEANTADLSRNMNIWWRIRQGYQLQQLHTDNPRIDQERTRFANHATNLEMIAQRSTPYIYHIVEALEKRNMPLELALLPVIESSYDPLAYSSARASGLWQFMPATGRNFKLEQTHWYDGRRDVIRSTEAALNYLTYLNKLFNGDWLLTLAAYNAGEGTVSRAIKRNQAAGLATDYWNLKLPAQTQAYVPKLLALAQIFTVPHAYGVQLPEVANEPYFSKVALKHALELSYIARIAKLSPEQLIQLNPAFKQGIAFGGSDHLLVPTGHAQQLQERLANLKPSERYQWPTYTVRSNDNLSRIAQRHGTTVAMLRDLNSLQNNILKVGQTLKLPQKTTASAYLANNRAKTFTTIHYNVRSGDHLSGIAARHQVTVKQIRQWNSLTSDHLRIGQTLRIQSPATHYIVRSGDSLSSIASRHNVSVKQLKHWNTLNSNLLRPGQKLTLYL